MATDNIIFNDTAAFAQVGGFADTEGYLAVYQDGGIGDQDCWIWKIMGVEFDVIDQSSSDGDQIRTPSVTLVQPVEVLGTFISFLLACAESQSEDSENYHLFPPTTREWAEMASDELQMLALEIEGIVNS